jgi:hypothetical protein
MECSILHVVRDFLVWFFCWAWYCIFSSSCCPSWSFFLLWVWVVPNLCVGWFFEGFLLLLFNSFLCSLSLSLLFRVHSRDVKFSVSLTKISQCCDCCWWSQQIVSSHHGGSLPLLFVIKKVVSCWPSLVCDCTHYLSCYLWINIVEISPLQFHKTCRKTLPVISACL